jgi:hypothetical protein
MKRFGWQILFGSSLLILSTLLYFFHYLIFKDAHHILIYLLGDIAFLPMEVLLVTLILDRLLNRREKRALLKKLNMVIGAFFSEVGASLLKALSQFDPDCEKIRKDLMVTQNWSDREFFSAQKGVQDYDHRIDIHKGDLVSLQSYLIGKRNFFLVLLENPNLLEHESFTELLWAVFHLTEELSFRTDVRKLSAADYAHLSMDIKRAYVSLISEWLAYMKHLKGAYPYLFHLAVRIGPFDPNAAAEIR